MLTSPRNLQAEVVLDPSIQFCSALAQYPPQAIFLTGATGFVGVYLLDELLRKTTADIYCLVRARHFEAAKERLRNHLENYDLWPETSRIIPVVGDLSQPFLALSKEKWNELAERIDVIYHNAAQVNAFYPYAKLKAANVLGTQEILRLASVVHVKPVHFVSTLAVFFSPVCSHLRLIKETDHPDVKLSGGYKQSKWVAEQIIMLAQQRGLPACIYRTSRITGHSQTGMTGNVKDFFHMLLKGCFHLGQYPTLKSSFNLIPVDYVSQAVVHLAQQKASLGKIFHLSHPQPITWYELFNQICVLGYDLKEITYDQWREELQSRRTDSYEAKFYSSLLLLLRSPHHLFSEKPHFDAHNTLKGLENTSITCPPIDISLLSVYVSYLQKIGYLPSRNVLIHKI